MAIQSLATAHQAMIEAAKVAFGKHPEDVISVVEYGADRLNQLAELFSAIASVARNAPKDVSAIKSLAELGSYVASDTANYLDCERESYAGALKAATCRP